jgi:DHA2 family multidrug resistance protein
MAEAALPRSAAGDRSLWLIAVIVSIATFMEVLDIISVNVALRHIAGSLATSLYESTGSSPPIWCPMGSCCRSAAGSPR